MGGLEHTEEVEPEEVWKPCCSPGPPAAEAEPIAPETPVAARSSTQDSSLPATAAPQAQVNGLQGLGPVSSAMKMLTTLAHLFPHPVTNPRNLTTPDMAPT